MSILIRRAVPADAAMLADLAARTFHDTFAAANSAQDMAQHLAASYSPSIQLAEINAPHIRTLIAERDGVAIAYAQLRSGKPPDCVRVAAPIELWRLYVDKPALGRGTSQFLMAAIFEDARTVGASAIWLGVWEHNPRALAFYRKYGFREVGSHVFQLGSDPQTDLIMLLDKIG
jgi:ribosomal protein S18 acetylase RimI-like enzyme